jgi:hypothetical protein
MRNAQVETAEDGVNLDLVSSLIAHTPSLRAELNPCSSGRQTNSLYSQERSALVYLRCATVLGYPQVS